MSTPKTLKEWAAAVAGAAFDSSRPGAVEQVLRAYAAQVLREAVERLAALDPGHPDDLPGIDMAAAELRCLANEHERGGTT